MNQTIKGHCHCKKIKYELTPPTEFCSHCHCESCRRIHGAAFVTWTSVPNDQLEIVQGERLIKVYESSPGIQWMSCSHCSSPLFQSTYKSKKRIYIAVASLVGRLDRVPDCHVSFEEKVDWVTINDGLPQFKQKASERLN